MMIISIFCFNGFADSKKINFHPRPSAPADKGIPNIKITDRVCIIGEQRYRLKGEDGEMSCTQKGGHVQLTSGATEQLTDVKDAPAKDNSGQDHLNKMMQPPPKTWRGDETVRGNVHYDSLDSGSH